MVPENIHITQNIGQSLQSFFIDKNYSKVGILVDENTLSYCIPIVKNSIINPLMVEIKSGEENKTLTTSSYIWKWMTEAGFDRHSLLINLGGGVIGDMGGFCAATYKRGLDFINLPTTLLSQVDASIGGKLGIDFMGYKNHIGLFKEPEAIYIYPGFLDSLPENELRSGFAEVIKHALIADKNYWNIICKAGLDKQNWSKHIAHSVQVKSKVVSVDPFEKGLRKILNFGHTIGHAIESYFLSGTSDKLLHGEAIAAGMICEACLSYEKKLLSKKGLDNIVQYVVSVFGLIDIKEKILPEIATLIKQDKKNEKSKINCSLLNGIGNAVYNIATSEEEIIQALHFYLKIKG